MMVACLNILTTKWLPVVRRSGSRSTIAPHELTDQHDTDPIMTLDWPRPDFCVAGMELLMGLLATACPPEGHSEWLDWWNAPPAPNTLKAAFAPLAAAFNLDGDGPRFLQDREDLISDAEPVEQLMIEAPGTSTRSKNTDLLIRRGQVVTLGRSAAVVALYTFQAWAPSGGAGNRTGLRGGGPMVTMVLPGDRPTLWQTVWANVPAGEAAEPDDLPQVFPWLLPTLTSKDGRIVTPVHAHPLQCWWGMPRRIRLDFTPSETPLPCGLTGTIDYVSVKTWRQRPHGPNYAAWGGVHPLTPTYQLKLGTERLALHPQPGGIGYRHWLGLVLEDASGLRQPARAIATWRALRQRDAGCQARLLAAGFDMDNMKARGFVESIMPLAAAPELVAQVRMDALTRRLVLSAEAVSAMLRSAIRTALFSAGATVKQDLEVLSLVREQLWDATELAFFKAVAQPLPEEGAVEKDWHVLLSDSSLALFDETAPMDPDVPPLARQGETVPRLVKARRNLMFGLQGFGREGQALFTLLNFPAREPKMPAKPRTRKAA